MSDSSKERPYVGIGVIVVREGKILLGERYGSHGADTFQIVGGGLEFGESFEETARREVKEETGLENIEIKGIISLGNDIAYNKHYVSIGILAESQEGEPYAAEPEKSKNWAWYDPKHLPDNMFLPSKKVIDNWLRGTLYTD